MLASEAVADFLQDHLGVVGHRAVLGAHRLDALMAAFPQDLVHVLQGLVGLGVLKVALLFLCQLLRPADVLLPELLACGVQPCGNVLGVMLGLRVMGVYRCM